MGSRLGLVNVRCVLCFVAYTWRWCESETGRVLVAASLLACDAMLLRFADAFARSTLCRLLWRLPPSDEAGLGAGVARLLRSAAANGFVESSCRACRAALACNRI